MDPATSLRDATVQDIQLELIRRSSFNDFDGEQVCELLHRHRDLWRAVIFDQPGVPNYSRPGTLPTSGLIKLRDLEDNIWNVDKLFILTHTPDGARQLATVFEQETLGAMPRVYEDTDEIDRALGSFGDQYGLLTAWWD